MDVYENLLKRVIDYSNLERVKEDEKTISAFTLWFLLVSEIKNFKNVLYGNKILLRKINEHYKELFRPKKEEYKKATSEFDFKVSKFTPCKFERITSEICENNIFKVNIYPQGKDTKPIEIYKDKNDDNYYGNNISSYLIETFKDDFDKIFNTLEFFAPILKNDFRPYQIIYTPTFTISFYYPIDKDLELNIKLNKNIDPNDSQYKKYYNKNKTIHEIIQENMQSILLNTEVNVKDLNYLCSSIVKKKLKNREENKIKKRVK